MNWQRWICRNPSGDHFWKRTRLWAINQLHFLICEMVAVRFIDLSKALWDTGVKNHLLRAAVRSLLWVCEKVIGGPRQAHADSSKCCEITWVEWSICYSEWLYTVLASLPGPGGEKLERVTWNSGFLQNILLLWSLQMLRLVAFPLLCGMRGGEEAYGVCAGEGEAWKVVHLQDNCIGSRGGLPRYQAIYSASGFIWYEQENSLCCLSLTKEAHF